MTQQSVGMTYVVADQSVAGTIGMSGGGGDTHDGFGMGASGQFMASEDSALLREEAQLQLVGTRRGPLRLFGRIGLGFNVGWMNSEFGGGGSASAELGAAIGRKRDVYTVHLSVSRIGRFGDAPGATMLGLHLGWGKVWREGD